MKISKFLICVSLLLTLNSSYAGNEGGGGNTLQNKLLQSFIRNPLQMENISNELRPALDNLKNKVPAVYDLIINQNRLTTFYIVPVEHKLLPQKITGIPFKTNQTAIQLENEVWISEVRFSTLSSKEKAKLIIHELLEHLFVDNSREALNDEDSSRLEGMAIVRKSVDYLFSEALKDDENKIADNLENLLGWKNSNMPWAKKDCGIIGPATTYHGTKLTLYADGTGCHLEGFEFNFETKTQRGIRLEDEKRQNADELKLLTIAYPKYKENIFKVISAVKDYCQETNGIFKNQDELSNATSAEEREILVTQFKKLNTTLVPYLIKAKMIGYEYAKESGLNPVQIKKEAYDQTQAILFYEAFIDVLKLATKQSTGIFLGMKIIEEDVKNTNWYLPEFDTYENNNGRTITSKIYKSTDLSMMYSQNNVCEKQKELEINLAAHNKKIEERIHSAHE